MSILDKIAAQRGMQVGPPVEGLQKEAIGGVPDKMLPMRPVGFMKKKPNPKAMQAGLLQKLGAKSFGA